MGIVFLVAAAVRTAQFPFTVWLTDTAASAAPVIALAAATIAPLGLYLVARIYPVVAHAPRALPVIALVGALSAALSAATGIAQRSITRIAACAVAAELGIGLVALGMGGYSAGLFVALTSVLSSTLLLLAVGNLVRIYRTDDLAEMGGAWQKLRTSSIALGVWAVLAGGFGFSAYYALVVGAQWRRSRRGNIQRDRTRGGGRRHRGRRSSDRPARGSPAAHSHVRHRHPPARLSARPRGGG